ncbi:predicted protein [Naegleria gruberi]|uniref:Predicted protein n=1 Tax=Naegleria gruberi TaxID=5762 RepID=D2VAY8_NAEGR|nr:uncharacterized protein NAEGRDRAFT_48079 [Naegleria gruberi]EFC46163.1 predicted protein [Naegleria gruberi]|eukprot:XP_002678907.1 predicted protein [Naegleria gruberi strain NEG-M]
MQIVKLFGAIKKKLSPRHYHEENHTTTITKTNQKHQQRRCHSSSNTPRGRRNSSSSSLHYSSGGEDDMMIIEDATMIVEEEEHFFVWDTEKIRANISRKQQPQQQQGNNSASRISLDGDGNNRKSTSSMDDANSTNSNHTNHHQDQNNNNNNNTSKRTSRKLFSKYKRSSSVSSCLDELALKENKEEKKKSSTSPRFDFFSKKRRSSGDLDCKRTSSTTGALPTTQPSGTSSTSQSEDIDYSEFNLRIPSSRTLNMLLSEPKTISPTSQSSPRVTANNSPKQTSMKEELKSETSTSELGEKKMLEPNNSMHQSSSSFDAFFEDYSNDVLDQTQSNNQNSNKSLSSLANNELCSMKSFKRTPSSAKPPVNQKKNESCELKTNRTTHGVSSTFSSSSSSTSIDMMGEDTLMKYGIVRISFEPLTSNTTTPQPQQTTAELLEKLQQ